MPHQRTNRRRPKRSRASLFANDIDNNDSTNNVEPQIKKPRLNDKNKNKIISEKLVNQWLEYVGLDKHTSEYYDHIIKAITDSKNGIKAWSEYIKNEREDNQNIDEEDKIDIFSDETALGYLGYYCLSLYIQNTPELNDKFNVDNFTGIYTRSIEITPLISECWHGKIGHKK
eukprot:335728_1